VGLYTRNFMVEGEVLVSDVAKGLCLGRSFRFEEL